MPSLDILTQETSNGVVLVEIGGFLDAHTFENLEATLDALYQQGKFKIVMGLTQLNYISSAGVGVLVAALGTVQAHQGKIVLVDPAPNVLEIFDLLGITHMFTIAKDHAQALRAFA
ncbi:MAG: STAS domain-containing protein [Planctomycetota bacterium]